VAMDILPVQASAVPCERVFSSSKETCTLRRNRTSPRLLEALQILKFSFRKSCLSYTNKYVVHEQDHSISGPLTGYAVN
ncbi:hypothetical protein PLICRDRAFT_119748, partial [Plicaturopsis crispa FD-325 SS-3]